MDTYTRIVLTVIAVALVAIAAQGFGSPIASAHAADRLDCRIDGPIEIKGLHDELRVRVSGEVKVEQTHGEAGSSRTYPLYVRTVE